MEKVDSKSYDAALRTITFPHVSIGTAPSGWGVGLLKRRVGSCSDGASCLSCWCFRWLFSSRRGASSPVPGQPGSSSSSTPSTWSSGGLAPQTSLVRMRTASTCRGWARQRAQPAFPATLLAIATGLSCHVLWRLAFCKSPCFLLQEGLVRSCRCPVPPRTCSS